MPAWIAALITLTCASAAGYGVVAMVRPTAVMPRDAPSPSGPFFPMMYAARAIPLGLVVGIGVWVLPSSPALVALLLTSGLAQAADVAIGLRFRTLGMVLGAGFAALCHAIAVVAIL